MDEREKKREAQNGGRNLKVALPVCVRHELALCVLGNVRAAVCSACLLTFSEHWLLEFYASFLPQELFTLRWNCYY